MRPFGSGSRNPDVRLFRANAATSAGTFYRQVYLLFVRNLDVRQPVDTMKTLLLATVTLLACAAPSFAAEPAKSEPAKTVGMAPASFYLAQDTATMRCQIVETQPVAGGSMKLIGAAHPTKASAETALKADKECKN